MIKFKKTYTAELNHYFCIEWCKLLSRIIIHVHKKNTYTFSQNSNRVFYNKVDKVTLPVVGTDMSIRLYSLPDTMGRSKHNGFVSPGRVTPKDGTCDFSTKMTKIYCIWILIASFFKRNNCYSKFCFLVVKICACSIDQSILSTKQRVYSIRQVIDPDIYLIFLEKGAVVQVKWVFELQQYIQELLLLLLWFQSEAGLLS